MTKVALLIGVSDYTSGLSALPAAVRDVAALQRVLQDPALGEFDQVKTLLNPEPQAMQYKIETLFSGCSKDDKQGALKDYQEAAPLYRQQGNTEWYNHATYRITELENPDYFTPVE